ncbi:MAG: nucleotidyltransferase domain-containing protein [Myxococcales bacterium]|nr:nucleotidyltransferase domain-containing protein [Myxococcales bacterium]
MDCVQLLQRLLAEEPQVELAVSFGSRASGRARPTSDVDLGVRFEPGVSPSERVAFANQLERALGAPLDLIDLDEAPPLLRMEMAPAGVVVKEATPGSWVSFRARAMLDWWDFAPYARRFRRAAIARLEGSARGAR